MSSGFPEKSRIKQHWLFLGLCLFIGLSCQNKKAVTPELETVSQSSLITSLFLSPDRVLAIVGEEFEFVVYGKNEKGTSVSNLSVGWVISDTTIVSINGRGKATCLKEGVAYIHAMYGDTLSSNTVRLDVLPATADAYDMAKTIGAGERSGVRLVYTDLEPNLKFKNVDVSFVKIDLDDDGLYDFEIQRSMKRSGDRVYCIAINALRDNSVCVDTSYDLQAQTEILSLGKQPDGYETFFQNWAHPIDEGELINRQRSWAKGMATLYYFYRINDSDSPLFGTWGEKLTTCYIGVRLKKKNDYHYGWIKFAFGLSIAEYAYRK